MQECVWAGVPIYEDKEAISRKRPSLAATVLESALGHTPVDGLARFWEGRQRIVFRKPKSLVRTIRLAKRF